MRTLTTTHFPTPPLQDQPTHRNRRRNNNPRYNEPSHSYTHSYGHNHYLNYNHNYTTTSHYHNTNDVNGTENILYSYAKKYKLCYFHMLNQCKYGQECQFTHGLACVKCHRNVFNPLLPIQNQIIDHKEFCMSYIDNSIEPHQSSENISVLNTNDNTKFDNEIVSHIASTTSLNPNAKEFEINSNKKLIETNCNHQHESISSLNLIEDIDNNSNDDDNDEELNIDNQFPVVECGICYEKFSSTSSGDKTLGLLANCNHVFCYNCIKKWRSTVLNLSSVKSCPLCRKISFYIIPSSIYPKNEEEKNLIIAEYRKSRMKIRCKYYRYPEHQFCPFGDECFYAHLLPNGERAVLGPPHVQLEYRSSRNTDLHYISQSEEWWNSEVLRQIREIIESSSFDDHDIQTLLSTLSQIILISEGGRAFREPETILHIRHNTRNTNGGNQNNNNNNNNNNNQASTSEVTVSVEPVSTYHPSSSQISSPISSNSPFTQSSSFSPLGGRNMSMSTNVQQLPSPPHLNCTCPCHRCHNQNNSNQNSPLFSNLNNTITAINNSSEPPEKESDIKKDNFKNNKK